MQNTQQPIILQRKGKISRNLSKMVHDYSNEDNESVRIFFRKYHFSVSIYIDQQFRFSVIYLLLQGHSNRETNEAQLCSTSQLGFVYGRLLILQSEL